MTETIVKLVGAAGLLIPVLAAFWVWRDANRLKRNGAEVNPVAWVVLVFLMWPVGLPVYLLLFRNRSQSSPPQGGVVSPEPLVIGVVSFLVTIALSMVVTWILIYRYPVPDDEAIYLGLLGFFFVLFLDLFFTCLLIGPKVRKGEGLEAAGLSLAFLGVGLLVASVVGVLPWCLRWLINAIPWLPKLSRYTFVLLVLAQLAWAWRLRRARRRSAP